MRQRILAALVLSASTTAQSASFTPLGDLDGGVFFSRAYGISADGSVVVGASSSAVGGGTAGSGLEAFRWTAATGMVGLGDLDGGGLGSEAYGVSADGSVVVGKGDSGNHEAFRWTAATGMVGLGDLDGGSFSSFAYDVSADGSVVVGTGDSGYNLEAFRWTAGGGMVGLGDLGGGSFESQARAVSADGSVVVGQAYSASGREAFRWTAGSGMVGLGDLEFGSFESGAYGISADGSVVVGQSWGQNREAFRWTAGSGMVALGYTNNGGFGVNAFDASADGSVVVGAGLGGFVWTEADGIERLLDVLVANGATGLTGWTIHQAEAISDDGQWIAGWGVNPSGNYEAFLANVAPVPLPAAAWLFSGALGLLGWMKRRVDSPAVGSQFANHVSMSR